MTIMADTPKSEIAPAPKPSNVPAVENDPKPSRLGRGAGAVLHDSPRLKTNNFDLLRLVLAGVVCLVHSYGLSDYPALAFIPRIVSSSVAVQAFFVVSGFLIFMSFERSSSLASYASKRVRRLYPAYFVVIMLCGFGLFTVSSKPFAEYFSSKFVKYVLANLTFMNFVQPGLPGVFEWNKMPAVDGALWTLKVEVMFYCSVPIFVYLFRRLPRLPLMLMTYLASVAYATILGNIAERSGSGMYAELAKQLPGQLCYFISGGFLYYYLPLFERRIGWFLTPAALVLLVNTQLPLPVLYPFAMATTVIFFGLFLYAGDVGKYGDFSYGTYILHFPIIQLLVGAEVFRGSPWLFLFTVVLLTSVGAVAMWHLVEKRFLLRSSHYIEKPSAAQNRVQSFHVEMPATCSTS